MPPRKKKHAGLLAVDPSWKGLGVAAYVPVHNVEFACCLDIRDGIKRFDLPKTTVKLVCKHLHQLLLENPQLRCCDRIVIEDQFKTKMRNLEYIVASCLLAMMPHATVEFVSILKLKRHFSLECTGSHYQNKKEAVKYVSEKAGELLVGQHHDLNDNRCDAILLLNYSVQTNKLEFMDYGNCSICDNPLEVKVSNSAANPGRSFITCPNAKGKKDNQPANKCNNAFQWLDANGIPEPKKYPAKPAPAPAVGQKRTAAASNLPNVTPPAKRMVPADQYDLTEFKRDLTEMKGEIERINGAVGEIYGVIDQLIEQSNKLAAAAKKPPPKRTLKPVVIPMPEIDEVLEEGEYADIDDQQ